jgi:hypothetical protein
MSTKEHGKRIEKKVATKVKAINHDVERGVLWAGTELVKGGRTVGHDAKRAGKAVGREIGRGGRRVEAASRRIVTRAGDRLQARRRARSKRP